jgi:outer membrane protein assembly factor BamB
VARASAEGASVGEDSVSVVVLPNGAPLISSLIVPALAYATDTIWLVARASDPESSAVRLTWSSDRSGLIGEGDTVAWMPGPSFEGTHFVSLTASDPQGNASDTTVELRALPTGRFLWSRVVQPTEGLAGDVLALADDGTIYAGFQSGDLLAFSSGGDLRWAFDAGTSLWDHSTGLTVAADGRVFLFGFSGMGYALSAGGALLWQAQLLGQDPHGRFALAPDGALYAGGANRIIGPAYAWLRRVDPTSGAILWEVQRPIYDAGPIVGPSGDLVIQLSTTLVVDTAGAVLREDTVSGPLGSGRGHYMAAMDWQGLAYYPGRLGWLSCVRPDGSVAWQVRLLARIGEPVIASDGTVFVASADYPDTGSAYAVAADGSIRWQVTLDGYSYIPRLALLSDGTLWVALGSNLYRLATATGALVEVIEFASAVASPLAVDAAGTVYLITEGDRVFAIRGPAPLDPGAPWPVWRRDNRRTASVPRP